MSIKCFENGCRVCVYLILRHNQTAFVLWVNNCDMQNILPSINVIIHTISSDSLDITDRDVVFVAYRTDEGKPWVLWLYG